MEQMRSTPSSAGSASGRAFAPGPRGLRPQGRSPALWAETPYGAIPAPCGGDIHSVVSPALPPAGSFWLRCQATEQESPSLGRLRGLHVGLAYGLSSQLSVAVTAAHFDQDRGISDSGLPVRKRGPGDTRFSLKARSAPDALGPLALGLQASLRVPTGYDLEGDELLSFTSRSLDVELLGIVAYQTPRLGLYFNPGISLPGRRWPNELLGGIGLEILGGLPLGLEARGEYVTRYDLPDDDLHHAVFAAIAHPLPLGLALEVGVRKPLLSGETGGEELSLRLGLGQPRAIEPRGAASPCFAPPVRVDVAPARSLALDPHGLGEALRQALIRALARRSGLAAGPIPRGGYLARLDLVSLDEGTGRGLSIPHVLASPQITLAIDARLTLISPQGALLLEEQPLTLRLERGTGLQLFPSSGDEDTWVPTTPARAALRDEAIVRLARQAADRLTAALRACEGD
jgi:hypothetical protein